MPTRQEPVSECTAYLPPVEAASAAASDSNRGVAFKVVQSFFGPEAARARLPAGVRYTIALAPDPVHTNLSLVFDREISLIQQSAQDEGYEYDSSWLPWSSSEAPPLDSLADRQYEETLTEQRQTCPGILLFRRAPQTNAAAERSYDSALAVLVVGEQATGGVNQKQWANAVDWLARHASRAPPADDGILRVLGPTFTGSLVSLERDLHVIYARPEDDVRAGRDRIKAVATQPSGSETAGAQAAIPLKQLFPAARIFSGTVTSCSAIHWFQQQLGRDAGENQRLYFGSFQENDALHLFRFLNYLQGQGTDAKDVAILSEDETAYASLPRKRASSEESVCDFPYSPLNRPVHLVYPRDISALRDAYQKESVFESTSGTPKDHTTHLVLEESGGSEAGAPSRDVTDTVVPLSGSLAALDEEASLYGVVSFLRTHHTRYLVLRCSNPLDFLFLTRFFHRAYPEARVVTVGADLLFRREIDTTEFRGVLSLSSYPLLPREQHWSQITQWSWDQEPHTHLIFDGHLSEGQYIAARYLLQDEAVEWRGKPASLPLVVSAQTGEQPLKLNRVVPTPDYTEPFWFSAEPPAADKIPTHPPTWLVAVGRDGYWPVAVLNDKERLQQLDQPPDRRLAETKEFLTPPAPRTTMVQIVSVAGQHYELEPGSGNPSGEAGTPVFSKTLLSALPLPWLLCLILAVMLVVYQTAGMISGVLHASDGLFSIFRRVDAPVPIILLSLSCALAILPMIELVGVAFLPRNLDLVRHSNGLIWLAIGLAAVSLVAIPLALAGRWYKHGPRQAQWPCLGYFLSVFVLLGMLLFAFRDDVGGGSVPLFYRVAHLTDGVSPLIPALLLSFGFYLWLWQAIAGGLILAGPGCPTLPDVETHPSVASPWPILDWVRLLWERLKRAHNWLTGCRPPSVGAGPDRLDHSSYRVSQHQGAKILKVASPLCVSPRIIAVPVILLMTAFVCFPLKNLPLLSLEGHPFNLIMDGTLLVALVLTSAEAARLYYTWIELRVLLHALARLRLRRTIARLRPIDANSIWSVSGNVRRVQYTLFTQQIDAALRLLGPRASFALLPQVRDYSRLFISLAESPARRGHIWDKQIEPVGRPPEYMRQVLSDAVAEVYTALQRVWEAEDISLNLGAKTPGKTEDDDTSESAQLPLNPNPVVQAAEEFVAFHYIAFIQNIVARMRTMTLSMICLFVAVCLSISFYPFVPRTEIGIWMLLNLLLIGSAVAFVYAGMERDEILSYIANTKPGKLGAEFWTRLAGFLAAPVLGILTTQCPSISDTVLQWLQPGLDAIK